METEKNFIGKYGSTITVSTSPGLASVLTTVTATDEAGRLSGSGVIGAYFDPEEAIRLGEAIIAEGKAVKARGLIVRDLFDRLDEEFHSTSIDTAGRIYDRLVERGWTPPEE